MKAMEWAVARGQWALNCLGLSRASLHFAVPPSLRAKPPMSPRPYPRSAGRFQLNLRSRWILVSCVFVILSAGSMGSYLVWASYTALRVESQNGQLILAHSLAGQDWENATWLKVPFDAEANLDVKLSSIYHGGSD